jgi:hypothetical protein
MTLAIGGPMALAIVSEPGSIGARDWQPDELSAVRQATQEVRYGHGAVN